MPSVAPSADPALILPTVPISPTAAPSNHARRASLKVLSRNIDHVVLGNLLFRTWYYSPYPDSVLLGEEQTLISSSRPGVSSITKHSLHGSTSINVRQNGVLRSLPEQTTLFQNCDRLYVCPYCFRYSPKLDAYVQHIRRHTVTYNPHSHSFSKAQDQDIDLRASSTSQDSNEDGPTWPVPASALKVYSHGGYTVWDVDGEREKLYCQNLSLFGKLFLEQKSVFFDTGGFHYFVLTYTPTPHSSSSPSNLAKKGSTVERKPGRKRAGSSTIAVKVENQGNTVAAPVTLPPDINLHTQVLGFFSKENLSWDANNLACILVFPPYQHRNLGQLLMAVSYKLSGWEWEDSIIGGPEKPLSTMGRKSYLRFWSERVARFIMGQTADADGRRVFDGVKKRKKVGFNKEELTVKEIGDRTGMLAEDVVAALNEMEVLEPVSPKKKKRKSEGQDEAAEEQLLSSMIVHRSKVLEWVQARGVNLTIPVKEEGFLGEWALSEVDEEEQEDQETEESE